LKCWKRVVEGRDDSDRRAKAVWVKLDSRRYWGCQRGEPKEMTIREQDRE
jgi:hypothetical protein